MNEQMVAFTSNPSPVYINSNFRQFEQGERHIDRIFHSWVLILMLKGVLHFTENGFPVSLFEGEWYFQRPGLVQEGNKPCPAPFYYYIHFDADLIKADIPGVSVNNDGGFLKPTVTKITLPIKSAYSIIRIRPLLDKLEMGKKMKPADLFVRQSVFMELLSQLADEVSNTQTGSALLAKNVMDYLNFHFIEDLGLCKLSKQFNFSLDYLSKLFKKYYSVSPMEYVQRLRINKALELLLTTDMSVEQISDASGFKDITVFFRTFKKRVGISPLSWRKLNRKIRDN